MRRPTLIILIVLLAVIAVTAIVQLNQESPGTPFEGPTEPGQLPSPSPSVVASVGY
jgi:hypothetical protein